MGEFSKILWALDNEIPSKDFERLCVDLLFRDGFSRIVPIGGTKDQGIDAEAVYWRGRSDEVVVVFQFSLENRWEQKLKRDTAKIAAHCPEATVMVFVTSQSVTRVKRKKLEAAFKKAPGWALTIHDREWLRLHLEEINPDLARKYLNVDLPATVHAIASRMDSLVLDGKSEKEFFNDQNPDAVRATLRERTRKEPSIVAHWHRLAKVEYYLRDYEGATVAINHALDLRPKDINLRLLRGIILAERGIENGSTPLLIEAKEIFSYAAAKVHRSLDFYNLANVLAALEEMEEAEKNYLRCIGVEPKNARAWKNLGTLYTKTGRHTKGMECFDRALAIDPELAEAHLSRATTLAMFLGKPDKAIASFDRAFELMPDIDQHWPYSRYWYSRALALTGRHEEALRQAELGLKSRPDDIHLLNQKAAILRHLWPRHPEYVAPAADFFAFRAKCIPNDYPGLVELIKLSGSGKAATDAWQLIDLNFEHGGYSLHDLANVAGITLSDFQAGFEVAALYHRFRRRHSLEDHCVTLHSRGLSPDAGLLPALNHALIGPFGSLARQFKMRTATRETEDLSRFLDPLLGQVSHLFVFFGPAWLTPVKPTEREDQTRLLAIGVVTLPEVVAAEAGRILGFLAGHFGIPAKRAGAQIANTKKFAVETGAQFMGRVISEWQMRGPTTK